jgi:cadmium resistance protein CadD (predicted permease)
MAKHPLSSIIMGIFLITVGIVLVILAIFGNFDDSWVTLIYGIPSLIIGVVLLVWEKEDDIEQRKDKVKMKENKKFSSKHETRLKGGNKK